jgi:hypothetical protein
MGLQPFVILLFDDVINLTIIDSHNHFLIGRFINPRAAQ